MFSDRLLDSPIINGRGRQVERVSPRAGGGKREAHAARQQSVHDLFGAGIDIPVAESASPGNSCAAAAASHISRDRTVPAGLERTVARLAGIWLPERAMQLQNWYKRTAANGRLNSRKVHFRDRHHIAHTTSVLVTVSSDGPHERGACLNISPAN